MDRTIAHHSRWGSLGCVAEQRYQDSVWSACIRGPMAESAVLLFQFGRILRDYPASPAEGLTNTERSIGLSI